MTKRSFKVAIASTVGLTALMFAMPDFAAINEAPSQQPATWNYSTETDGNSEASYPGDVQISGSLTVDGQPITPGTSAGTIISVGNSPLPPSDSLGVNGQFAYSTYGNGYFMGPKAVGTWANIAVSEFASTTVPFPSGLTGKWLSKNIATNGLATYVPNSVLSEAAPIAINAAPRRLFSGSPYYGTAFYTSSGLTIVDNNAAAPDGSMQASTITSTGSPWYLTPVPYDAIHLTAGTYTMWCTVKWISGGTGIGLGEYNTTVTSRTGTSAYQRLSGTFVYASGAALPGLFSPSGSPACVFQIIDFQIAPGTADPNPNWQLNSTQTHLILGPTPNYKVPAYTSGYLDYTTGNYGLIQWPVPRTPTNVTVIIVARQTAAPAIANFKGLLSDVHTYSNFGCLVADSLGNNNSPAFWINGTNTLPVPGSPSSYGNGNLTCIQGGGWSAFGFQFNAGVGRQSINDYVLNPKTSSPGSISTMDWFQGITGQVGDYGGMEIAGIYYFEAALSNAQIAAASSAAFAELAGVGITRAPQLPTLFAGDSNRAGSNGQDWSYQYALTTVRPYQGMNIGVYGATISNLSAQAAVDAAYFSGLVLNGRVPVAISHIGVNSFAATGAEFAGNPTGAVAELNIWTAAMKAAGAKVLVEGIPDCSTATSSTWASDVTSFRSLLMAQVGTQIDGYADYQTNANVATSGHVTAATNTTFFASDGLHLLTAGFGQEALVAGPLLDTLGTAA